MAYITLVEAEAILSREGAPSAWTSIEAITGPPALTIDAQKLQFIERATRRIETISFQDESPTRDRVRYTDGFVTGSDTQKIPYKIALATAVLSAYYAGNILSEYKEVPQTLLEQSAPGVDDLPLTVQAALWPFISDELKARDAYTGARAGRRTQSVRALSIEDGTATTTSRSTSTPGGTTPGSPIITLEQVYAFIVQILREGSNILFTPNALENTFSISSTAVGGGTTRTLDQLYTDVAAFVQDGDGTVAQKDTVRRLIRIDLENAYDSWVYEDSVLIPNSKLPESAKRPAPSLSGLGGLTQTQINALIAVFARFGDTSLIPVAKLGSGTADATKVLYGDNRWGPRPQNSTEITSLITANVLSWALALNTDVIPNDKLPASAKRAAPTLVGLGGLNLSQITDRINQTVPVNRRVPPGGNTGQVLKKSSNTNYDVDWADDTQSSGGTGGLTQAQVDGRIAKFARVNALQRTTVDKQQAISDAFDEGGWINAAGSGSTATTAPYVREEVQTTTYNATLIQGGTYGSAYTAGARRSVQFIAIRVPVAYPFPIDELRLRVGGGIDHDDDPADPLNEQWFPLEDATEIDTPNTTYNYYQVGPINVPTGDTWRVQRNTKFRLDRSRIDGGKELLPPNGEPGQYPVVDANRDIVWKHEAHILGDTLVNNLLETISLSTGSSNNVRSSAPSYFSPIFDLDDSDKQHGEFHVAINVRLDNVTDVNMGFVNGKANQTAIDRERNISTIVFASTLRAANEFVFSSTGLLEGVAINLPTIYSGSTIVGEPEFLLVRNAPNNAGYYIYYTGQAGATTPNIRLTIRITFTPSDAPAAGMGGGSVTKFESAEISLPDPPNDRFFAAHGGTSVPDLTYAKLICKTANKGYAVGDEVQIGFSYVNIPGDNNMINVFADATNVYMKTTGFPVLADNTARRGTTESFIGPTDRSSWRYKLYAIWF